ncbi:hypothetical protein RD00_18335 [Pseudomonas amygdali pv. tabaci]|nr:hypothetical protein RD00_18335 [Pseudomonas amygdali pv. tabaci]
MYRQNAMFASVFCRHFSAAPKEFALAQEAFELNGILNPLQHPRWVKKEASGVVRAIACWVHYYAFAQGLSSLRSAFQRIAGYAPA